MTHRSLSKMVAEIGVRLWHFLSDGCLENGRTALEADLTLGHASTKSAIEPVRTLTKGRDAQHVFGNHASIVVPDGTGRGATDQHVWVGPHR